MSGPGNETPTTPPKAPPATPPKAPPATAQPSGRRLDRAGHGRGEQRREHRCAQRLVAGEQLVLDGCGSRSS